MSKNDETPVRFKGRDLILFGDRQHGGPLATQEDYDNFVPGYAHLQVDGIIWRHHVQIGTYEDLEFLPCKNQNIVTHAPSQDIPQVSAPTQYIKRH